MQDLNELYAEWTRDILDQARDIEAGVAQPHLVVDKLEQFIEIHPSIHFLPLNPSVGSRVGWSLSQQSSGERRGFIEIIGVISALSKQDIDPRVTANLQEVIQRFSSTTQHLDPVAQL